MKTHYHLIKDLCPLKTALSLVKLLLVLCCCTSIVQLHLVDLLYLFVKVRVYDLSADLTNFMNAVQLWSLHKQTELFSWQNAYQHIS